MVTTSTYQSFILKGTRHGLLVSVREDADWSTVIEELSQLTTTSEGFLSETSLTFDLGWREVSDSQFDQMITALHSQELTCNGILSTSLNTRTIAEERGYRAIIGRLGLAKHQGRRLRRDKLEAEAAASKVVETAPEPTPEPVAVPAPSIKVATVPPTVLQPQPTVSAPTESSAPIDTDTATESSQAAESSTIEVVSEPSPAELKTLDTSELESSEETVEPSQEAPRYQDEEPTLYLRKTLRSGQKVVFGGNVVLLGDLNPGAQIEADGDIIILGNLRGTVHAGAEGDRKATVITSSLRPTQLRIADQFWVEQKSHSIFRKANNTGTLKARLDGDSVVVEALSGR